MSLPPFTGLPWPIFEKMLKNIEEPKEKEKLSRKPTRKELNRAIKESHIEAKGIRETLARMNPEDKEATLAILRKYWNKENRNTKPKLKENKRNLLNAEFPELKL